MPVIFALYARYRNASLSFNAEGYITGYSEPSTHKDPVLKELQVWAMEDLIDPAKSADIHTLWESLKGICFGGSNSQHRDFSYLICSYLTSGPAVRNIAQSCELLSYEVKELLNDNTAKTLFEMSGGIGLLADEYDGWKSHTVYIPDAKIRYLDELVRSLNGNRAVTYTDVDLLFRKDVRMKSFDTILANCSVYGGCFPSGNQHDDICKLFDNLVKFRALHPEMELRNGIFAVDIDFCNSDQYKDIREKLVFLNFIDGVTSIEESGQKMALLNLAFSRESTNITFKRLSAIEEQTSNNKTDSFEIPLSIVCRNSFIIEPVYYLNEGKEDKDVNDYLLALVGSPLIDKDRITMEKNHLFASCEVNTVLGEHGLLQRLKEDSLRPLRTIHAIVLDARTGYNPLHPFLYGGIADILYQPSDVPVFIYADFPKQQLGDQLIYLLEQKRDSVFFIEGKDAKSLNALISTIRAKLDSLPSQDATVLSKYQEEIETANWMDKSGKLTRMIANLLKVDVRFGSSIKDAEDLLTNLRICMETVLKTIGVEQLQVLPPLGTPGELCQFLADAEYFDKTTKILYQLDNPQLMPDALSESLRFFIMMTNGGSHAPGVRSNIDVRTYMYKSGRPGIFKGCVQILLDLMCWFKKTYIGLPRKWFSAQSVQAILKHEDCVSRIKGRDYYYIGKVHLLPKAGLIDGLTAEQIRIKNISLDRYPVNKDTEGVRYYAKADDYDII